MTTINLTPTWAASLPILLAAYVDGTPEGQRLAKLELERMALICDLAVAAQAEETRRSDGWTDNERFLDDDDALGEEF